MNRRGNTKTLVAAHPGNQNALKAGVFSPRTLAPRVAELDAAISERPDMEVARDLLRRDLASLRALGELMDQSLELDGLWGRGGEPRTLIGLRLRLNQKLRQTLEQYLATRAPEAESGSAASPDSHTEPANESLSATIASQHAKSSLDQLSPREFDTEQFLRAVIITSDASVRTTDRLRARRLLTQRRNDRPGTCTCWATLKARDEIEFREWIDEAREIRVEPHPKDPALAAMVRQLAQGVKPEQPWVWWKRAAQAVEEVVQEGLKRARGEFAVSSDITQVDDPAVRRFWQLILDPNDARPAKERLDSFTALEQMKVLPGCTCPPKWSGS